MAAVDATQAARERYDLVIVGGGILGCCVLLESARLGLKALLVERGEFGGATSANSLRILHGGLRYLQSLDLKRFHESVAERRWFLQHFPERTEPLPCLMPLYGRGLKRASVLRLALAANDALSARRNRGVRADHALPPGEIWSSDRLRAACAFIDPRGLDGGALWYDARIRDPQGIVLDILGEARGAGAVALDGLDTVGLVRDGDRVAAIETLERRSGTRHTFAARHVVNATGPWAPELLGRFGVAPPRELHFARAWNLVLARELEAPCAVALTPAARGAQTLFLHGSGQELWIGTGHGPWNGDLERIAPDEREIEQLLAGANAAAPALALRRDQVRRVLAGLLPAPAPGSAALTQRATVVEHGARGGPHGLVTAVGIKFTTARATALRALRVLGVARSAAPAR